MSEKPANTVLPRKLGGGPHGLGDPNDKSLRRVEIDVMIPKKMRDIARTEKCFKEVEEFTDCCKDHNILMVVKCRPENSKLRECLTKWYNDENFKEFCKNQYLEERSDYRKTGIPLKKRLEMINAKSTRIGSNM